MKLSPCSALLAASCLVLLTPRARSQMLLYEHHGVPTDVQAQHGACVRNAGDVDGDGIADMIVGAPYADSNGANSGRARVYSGRTGAVLWTFVGASSGDELGFAVDGAGDIDHDGHADVMVGSPGFNPGNYPNTGYACVYSGRTGLPILVSNFTWPGDRFGSSVAGAGDVDGDEFDDVIFGSPLHDGGGVNIGLVLVMSGQDGRVIWALNGDGLTGAQFGSSVEGCGDVNGDGRPDIVVGAPFANSSKGAVYVYSGASGSLLWSVAAQSTAALFGSSVDGIQDQDGDGRRDILVGAPGDDSGGTDSGRVRVYKGNTGVGLFGVSGPVGSQLGRAVAGLTDIDGDGVAEFAAGGPYFDFFSATDAGIAYVYSGTTIFHTFIGTETGSLGAAIDSAGDLNGDGRQDLLVGAPRVYADGINAGVARVYLLDTGYPSEYCVAKVNSLGCLPDIGYTGVASVSVGNNFHVRASDVINRKTGLLLWSKTQGNAPPFGGGTLCVGGQIKRTPAQNSGGSALPAADCSGTYDFHFGWAQLAAGGLSPGDQLYCQWWSRDAGFAPPNNIGLTKGLAVTVLN